MKGGDPLYPFFKQNGLLVIDGGLATELEARGYDLKDELWSARLLLDDPEVIYDVHLDYLEAGADCIISASYQASFEGFRTRGLDEDEFIRLLEASVNIARKARDNFWSKSAVQYRRIRPLVAASIGPYGAALANGSEYTGDYGLGVQDLYNFHLPRWKILAGSAADILACETIPSYPETIALGQLLSETPDCAAWVSFSCLDEKRINDGTSIARAVEAIHGLKQVVAVGVNCSAPQLISGLVGEIKKVTDKPIIVYPNSGERYDPATGGWRDETEPNDFVDASIQWCTEGAKIIGGCCRTSPEHIRNIRTALLP
jgi:homocysteine S-methyltransferase